MCTLAQFNQQVSTCQDDAYTLAWYLLGDEAQAEAVTQAAIAATFQLMQFQPGSCRLLVFEQVLRYCSGTPGIDPPSLASFTQAALRSLTDLERQVIILVEILNLGYHETAQLLRRPVKEIMRALAQARRTAAKITL
jgi:DNA-directed RNA polymerase specialized sigma24 family protein